MALMTNVTQVVVKTFRDKGAPKKVRDPNCGAELKREEARYMLFRPGQTYYFCSRECREEYLRPEYLKKHEELKKGA